MIKGPTCPGGHSLDSLLMCVFVCDWVYVRSTLASQPPATPLLLIPFTPIKHLEVLCTRMLGPQAPLSFHKSSSCLKTMIKITSGQKQPLWNIYSFNPSEVSALLPAAMVEDGLNIFAEERMRKRGEQEVLSLSSLSSCLGLASDVWNPPRAFLPLTLQLVATTHTRNKSSDDLCVFIGCTDNTSSEMTENRMDVNQPPLWTCMCWKKLFTLKDTNRELFGGGICG